MELLLCLVGVGWRGKRKQGWDWAMFLWEGPHTPKTRKTVTQISLPCPVTSFWICISWILQLWTLPVGISIKCRTCQFFHAPPLSPLFSILYFLGVKIFFLAVKCPLLAPGRRRRVHWCERTSDQPYIGNQITQPENQKDCVGRRKYAFCRKDFSKLSFPWLLVSWKGCSAVWRILAPIAQCPILLIIILSHTFLKV